jgi:hypothetical protein
MSWDELGPLTMRSLLRIFSPPFLCAVLLTANPITPTVAGAKSATTQWLATWGASPQGPVPNTLSATGFDDQTVRDIVDTSVGGNTVRVQFANTFGRLPLDIGRAAIGIANDQAGLVPSSSGPVSFGWTLRCSYGRGLPRTQMSSCRSTEGPRY